MKGQEMQRRLVLAVIFGLSAALAPCLTGCHDQKAAAATAPAGEDGLRKQMEHRPTEAEMQQALAKAPPNIRAMVESQMQQSQLKRQPDAPKKASSDGTIK